MKWYVVFSIFGYLFQNFQFDFLEVVSLTVLDSSAEELSGSKAHRGGFQLVLSPLFQPDMECFPVYILMTKNRWKERKILEV